MLSTESLKKIDIEVAKYPADQKQSAVMASLRIAQQEKGWLAQETIAGIAAGRGLEACNGCESCTLTCRNSVHIAKKIAQLQGLARQEFVC